MWLIKNLNYWLNCNVEKRKLLAFNAKVIYFKKSLSKKCVDYLGPTYYNTMPLNLKSNIYVNKNLNFKKLILEWLF